MGFKLTSWGAENTEAGPTARMRHKAEERVKVVEGIVLVLKLKRRSSK